MALQLASVPLFLRHWDAATFGSWLTALAILSVIQLLDVSYHHYFGYELLREDTADPAPIWAAFSSSCSAMLIVAFVELGAVSLAAVAWRFDLLPLPSSSNAAAAGSGLMMVILLQALVWASSGSVAGLASRVVVPFGYYPRTAWWGVFTGIATGVAPLLAVKAGAGLVGAGIALAVATMCCNLAFLADTHRLMHQSAGFKWLSLPRQGFRLFLASQLLTVKAAMEFTRQAGMRLLLNPLVGAAQMAAFSTMRTGSNTMMQGLNTIAHPLMPELMRYLRARDQQRSEAAFATIWMVLIAALAPGAVVLQAIAPAAFHVWTAGKLSFDSIAFATLSASVLVYALAQPALAILVGNNEVRSQLAISAGAATCVLTVTLLSVPILGIRGASAALVLSEVVSAAGYVYAANRWLRRNAMIWPLRSFTWAALSVALASAGAAALALEPEKILLVLPTVLSLCGVCAIGYWCSLPSIVKQSICSRSCAWGVKISHPVRQASGFRSRARI